MTVAIVFGDLASRGLLLLVFVVAIILIAGIVLVVGRQAFLNKKEKPYENAGPAVGAIGIHREAPTEDEQWMGPKPAPTPAPTPTPTPPPTPTPTPTPSPTPSPAPAPDPTPAPSPDFGGCGCPLRDSVEPGHTHKESLQNKSKNKNRSRKGKLPKEAPPVAIEIDETWNDTETGTFGKVSNTPLPEIPGNGVPPELAILGQDSSALALGIDLHDDIPDVRVAEEQKAEFHPGDHLFGGTNDPLANSVPPINLPDDIFEVSDDADDLPPMPPISSAI